MTPDAGVAIVHAQREDSVLLIRRAERADDAWSGHWSLPGGRRDPDDADLLDTSLRELDEECGIRLGRDCMVAALPLTVARRRVGRYLLVAPFELRVENEIPAVVDPREAVEACWFPRKALADLRRHSLRPAPGMPKELFYPAIEVTGHVPLWGFTYRLLSDWVGLGSQRRQQAQAGCEIASHILEFVLSRGRTLEHGWEERSPHGATGQPVKVAAVRGVIPVEDVVARYTPPGCHVANLNCLEVRAGYIRVVGREYEEYLIAARDLS